MDTQRLKYFIDVAECLNFSEAAARIGISQSAVSQQIAVLEKQIGSPLIIRNRRPFQLTSAGKVLLREAYALVARSEEALKKTQLAASGIIGYLNVGFLGGIEKNFLPQVIREFREAYPNIDLSLHHYDWGSLNKALTREELDIGFTMNYGFDQFPQLVSSTLFTDVICVAMHRHHRLASESSIDIACLRNEVFVTFHPQTDYLLHNMTMQLCAEHGFTPGKVTLCWDLSSILFNVESGLGVTIVPGPVRKVAGRELRIIEISKPDRFLDIMVAWKKNTLNASIPVFVQKLKSLKFLKSLGVHPED